MKRLMPFSATHLTEGYHEASLFMGLIHLPFQVSIMELRLKLDSNCFTFAP